VQRVLVVDDDPIIRDVLVEALQDEGYAVVSCRDGQEALDVVAEQVPDLILLDLMMPRVDGWEFRKRQLATSGLRDVPVIILTAARGIEEHAQALHPAAAMAKPFNLATLLRTIEEVLRRG
jgi:CheY-like chemotaxis protein